MKIKDHLIQLSNPKSTTGNVPPGNFDTDLLKKWIWEQEKNYPYSLTDISSSQKIRRKWAVKLIKLKKSW